MNHGINLKTLFKSYESGYDSGNKYFKEWMTILYCKFSYNPDTGKITKIINSLRYTWTFDIAILSLIWTCSRFFTCIISYVLNLPIGNVLENIWILFIVNIFLIIYYIYKIF